MRYNTAIMAAQTAKEAHLLATQIQSARLAGDHETANRLIAEFNQRLFASDSAPINSEEASNPWSSPSESSSIDNELSELQMRYQALLAKKQGFQATATQSLNHPPANLPIQESEKTKPLPSLADVVRAEHQRAVESQSNPTNQSNGSATTNNQSPQVAVPIAPEKSPDFDSLISDYHDGVKLLLKQYLSEFSTELETPDVVLGPLMLAEFKKLWRTRQSEEPLLLKLPTHIQQRSVLLRYRDDLLNTLK